MSSWSRLRSRLRISVVDSDFTRAAASSMAIGRPSSFEQIEATSSALPTVKAKSARAAMARWTKSATAGHSASVSTEVPESGSVSGPTGYSRSPCTRSTVRLVTMMRSS